MLKARISIQDLTSNRLDSTYYRPEHLHDSGLCGKWPCKHLDELRAKDAPIVYGVLKPDDKGDRFRVAKAERFDGMFLWPEDADPVSQQMFEEFGRAEAVQGDLLIAIGGYVGRPAMVQDTRGLKVVVNRHLARVRIDPLQCEPYWVLAYFSSLYGERQLNREITGSVQAGINLCDLRLVDVPLPNTNARRYVSSKVWQAERLQAQARALISAARTLVNAFIQGSINEVELAGFLQLSTPWGEAEKLADRLTSFPRLSSLDAHRETKHTNRIAAGELTGLWTAQSYRPEITQALAQVRKIDWKPLGELCSRSIAQGRSPEYAKLEAGGYPCLKTRHVNGLFVDDSEPDWVTQDCARDMSAFKVERETILMNRSGAGSVGRCAVYLLDGAPLTNEHLLHIRVAEPHDACFITLVLSSWWGERAIEQGITGSTGQLNLSGDHVARVPIPLVAPEVQRGLGNLLRDAAAASRAARALTLAATQLVERLIEGTVTEAELVAAQQALDAGDTGPDRALLGALRAGDGVSPLFPDLDALYALLDQDEPALEEAA